MPKRKAEEHEAEGDEDTEDSGADLKPIGEVIKRLGRGRSERKFYEAFELDGSRYTLEDSILVTPEEKTQKPYVAIIKEIKQTVRDGSIAVTGQWFYRPEEAARKDGGSWQAEDTRELFYSFHKDEVPAESVMHKCVVHFVPAHKKPPTRSKHPGFIVRKVYDTVEKTLWNLTDKDYEDAKQKEIDLLVRKTQQALGEEELEEVPVVEPEPEKEEKRKPPVRRRGLPYPPPLVIGKEDGEEEEQGKGELESATATNKAETPALAEAEGDGNAETNSLLREHGALTGSRMRDRSLEKLLDCVSSLYETKSDGPEAVKSSEGQEGRFSAKEAVAAVSGLERAANDTINDIRKYNAKIRSLIYNLKNGPVLARRVVAKELDPLTVVSMSPAELKAGITASEKRAQEPEQPETVQMADVRCASCGEPQVGVKDIINAPHGDKYQLECLKCGKSWYSARDVISNFTTETINRSTPGISASPKGWERDDAKENERSETADGSAQTQAQAPGEQVDEAVELDQVVNTTDAGEATTAAAPIQLPPLRDPMEQVDVHKTEELMHIAVDYCPEVCDHLPEQKQICVTYDERGGARWRSTRRFSSGTFSAKIKTPSGNTSGLNSSFYLSTLEGPRDQDEIDFEFLGKDKSTVQTNYYTHGAGGREVIHDLGFDSSEEFHEYTIKWEPERIEWLIDGKSIRVAVKDEDEAGFPTRPCFLYASVWNAGDIDEGRWAGPYVGCDAPYVCTYKDVQVPCH